MGTVYRSQNRRGNWRGEARENQNGARGGDGSCGDRQKRRMGVPRAGREACTQPRRGERSWRRLAGRPEWGETEAEPEVEL